LSPPQVVPSGARETMVQLEVPLQARVAQVSLAQVMGVPAQMPAPLQASLKVQALPSLQAVPAALKVTVQLAVPLHARLVHASLAQVMGVPAQAPPAPH